MADPLGYGEGAEGDPGPLVSEFTPTSSADRVSAKEILLRGSVAVFASFHGKAGQGAPELVYAYGAFVVPYARGSTKTVEGAFTRLAIKRTGGWPPGVGVSLTVQPLETGETVCLGGAVPADLVVGD